jgi:hypothetical protein
MGVIDRTILFATVYMKGWPFTHFPYVHGVLYIEMNDRLLNISKRLRKLEASIMEWSGPVHNPIGWWLGLAGSIMMMVSANGWS